jgi:hypothetical protein
MPQMKAPHRWQAAGAVADREGSTVPKLRTTRGTALGASLTKPHEPEPSEPDLWAEWQALGADLTIETVRAQLLLDQAGVDLSRADRLRIVAAFVRDADRRKREHEAQVAESAAQREAEQEQRAEDRAAALEQPTTGCVYFIRHGEHVKIGTTVGTAEQRMRGMQLPPGAGLVAVIPERGRACEAELHRRFAATRVHGEWFATTPELEALISTFAV